MTLHADLAPLGVTTPPTLAVRGAVGVTPYGYKLVATNARGHGIASEEVTVNNGHAVLSTTRYVQITPPAHAGATGFDIYRTTGGATQGKIGHVNGRALFRDTGRLADSTEAPTTDTSGLWLYYTAWNTADSVPQSEDLDNHTLSLSKDGEAAEEMAGNGAEGKHVEIGNGEYAIQCAASEVDGTMFNLTGVSSTADVVILPTRIKP